MSDFWDSRRPVWTWTRKLRKVRRWKPSPGDNHWRYSRLRGLCTCYNELHSVWISVRAIVICLYVLQEFTTLWASTACYKDNFTLLDFHFKHITPHIIRDISYTKNLKFEIYIIILLVNVKNGSILINNSMTTYVESRDSAVGIETSYGLDDRGVRVRVW
jgi:hypothetical protein